MRGDGHRLSLEVHQMYAVYLPGNLAKHRNVISEDGTVADGF